MRRTRIPVVLVAAHALAASAAGRSHPKTSAMRRASIPALALVLAVASLLAASPPAGAAAQEATPPAVEARRLDLPAMVLTPGDLAGLGLEGFGKFGSGQFVPVASDDFAADQAAYLGQPEGEVRAAFAGARLYGVNMGLPPASGNGEGPPARVAFSSVAALPDAAAAAAAFAFQAEAPGGAGWTREPVAGVDAIADAATAIRASQAPAAGGPWHELYVLFRLGPLVATAGLGAPGEASAAGTEAEVKALAARLLERVEAVLAAGDVGLSALALRLDAGSGPVAFTGEGYRLLHGEAPPYYAGFEDDILEFPARFVAAEAIYEVEQPLRPGREQAPGDPYFASRDFAFAGGGAAAAFLAAQAGTIAGPATGSAAAEPVAGAAAAGEASLVLAVRLTSPDGTPVEGFAAFVRVRDTVASVLVLAGARPGPAVVEELLGAQAICLEAGQYAPAPVPEGLLTNGGATPVAVGTPAA